MQIYCSKNVLILNFLLINGAKEFPDGSHVAVLHMLTAHNPQTTQCSHRWEDAEKCMQDLLCLKIQAVASISGDDHGRSRILEAGSGCELGGVG